MREDVIVMKKFSKNKISFGIEFYESSLSFIIFHLFINSDEFLSLIVSNRKSEMYNKYVGIR